MALIRKNKIAAGNATYTINVTVTPMKNSGHAKSANISRRRHQFSKTLNA